MTVENITDSSPVMVQGYKAVANTELWNDGCPLELMAATRTLQAITTASVAIYGHAAEASFSSLPVTFSRYPVRLDPTGRQKIQVSAATKTNNFKTWPLRAATVASVGTLLGVFPVTLADGSKQFYLDPGATNKLYKVVGITPGSEDPATPLQTLAGGKVDVCVIESVSQYDGGAAAT